MIGSVISGVNDSALHLSEGGASPANVDNSMFYKTTGPGLMLGRAKPRDFNIDPKTLTVINAHNYDKIEDMGQLHIDVEAALEKLKINWHTHDLEKLKYLIRKTTIIEITKIEERKYVRREHAERKERLRRKKEEEAEKAAEAAMTMTSMDQTKSMIAGKKNVGFADKSQTSSPYKSPIKGSRAGTQSEADT